MSDSEDPLDAVSEGGDDLFGDVGDVEDQETASPTGRVLGDDELASDPGGDAESRHRGDYDDEPQHEVRKKVVMGVTTFRHRVPKPKDGALRVLRVPKFLKFLPEEYVSENFEPTEFDISNAKSENPQHVARVRRDATTAELKSNTNVYRWSDGSVTISIGGEQYEIQKKNLAPGPGAPYNELNDGHYYAAAAELASNVLMTVGHVTEQYNVKPNKAVGDDALSLLAERMALASKGSNQGDMMIRTTRDPELQKKQAELADKEQMKAQRRRENAAAKMDGGLGRSGRGGLSIGDLEGGRRAAGSARKRGAPGAGKPKRRRPEYDSDDDLPQGVGRHDDYDMEDGFIVGSDDEELESGAEEDDDDNEMDDEDDRPAPRSKKQRTREPEEDEDAEGDDVEPEAAGRARRRNVIDDDDE